MSHLIIKNGHANIEQHKRRMPRSGFETLKSKKHFANAE